MPLQMDFPENGNWRADRIFLIKLKEFDLYSFLVVRKEKKLLAIKYQV